MNQDGATILQTELKFVIEEIIEKSCPQEIYLTRTLTLRLALCLDILALIERSVTVTHGFYLSVDPLRTLSMQHG